MSDQKRFDESDALALLQSLGNYLQTDVEVTRGTIERKVQGQTRQSEGHLIKVSVRNTAPSEPKWPAVVFTGIGLAAKVGKSRFQSSGLPTPTRMQNEGRLRVDLTNVSQGGATPLPNLVNLRLDGKSFPVLTPDESKHGFSLFPGQSIVYEIGVLARECADLNDLKLWIEATLSRRHLFHYCQELKFA